MKVYLDGPDQWRLRLQAHTRATTFVHVRTAPTPVGKVTTLLHVRTAPTPAGKVTTLLHVRTAPTPVGKVTPRIPHTPGRKLGSLFSQPSLGPMAASQRRQSGFTAIILQT